MSVTPEGEQLAAVQSDRDWDHPLPGPWHTAIAPGWVLGFFRILPLPGDCRGAPSRCFLCEPSEKLDEWRRTHVPDELRLCWMCVDTRMRPERVSPLDDLGLCPDHLSELREGTDPSRAALTWEGCPGEYF